MTKKLQNLLMALVMCFLLIPVFGTEAKAGNDIIEDPEDERIELMLEGIDKQSFDLSFVTADQVKDLMRYFIYDCAFSPMNKNSFPYYNYKNFVTYVNDGIFYEEIRISKGCCAYCNFVSKVIYGDCGEITGDRYHSVKSFKSLIMNEGQAGEHIRVDDMHSLTLISCDDKGFYYLGYMGDFNRYICLGYWTYDSFIRYYSGYNIFLYNANYSTNVIEPVVQLKDQPQSPIKSVLWTVDKPAAVKYGTMVWSEEDLPENKDVINLSVSPWISDLER